MKTTLLVLNVLLFSLLGIAVARAQEDPIILELKAKIPNCTSENEKLEILRRLAGTYLFNTPDSSQRYTTLAFEGAQAAGETEIAANSANYQGILLHNQGHYLAALEWYQKAFGMFNELNNKSGAAKVLNNIGIIYSVTFQREKAIECYKEALAYNEMSENHDMVCHNLYNIAEEYVDAKNFELAALYKDKLDRYQDRFGVFIPAPDIDAQILRNKGRYNEALVLLDSALHVESADSDLTHMGSVRLLRSELFMDMGKYDLAEQELAEANTIGRNNDYNDIKLEYLKSMARLMSLKGWYERAYSYEREYGTMKDSLDRINNLNHITELHARYEAGKKESEIARQAQQLERKNFWLLIVGVSTCALAAIIFLTFFTLQKKRRLNGLLTRQNQEIKAQRQKIISSISYAKRIQHSSLAPQEVLSQWFPESFIFFRPKDIVSGDFYWLRKVEDKILLAVVDCTGHGVPGAFMSLIACEKLNKAVGELGLRNPGDIITAVNREIITSLNQENAPENAQDGLDISLCAIDTTRREILFSGANAAITMVSGSEQKEIKSTALGVGGATYGSGYRNGFCFENTRLDYNNGDSLFMYTDGFYDQFGGLERKKFNKSRFREVIDNIARTGIRGGANYCSSVLEQWKGSSGQTDDILVLGLRL